MNIKKILLILVLCVVSFSMQGQQDTLLIRCAYVNDDGSTTLTWENSNVISPVNATSHATFNGYQIGMGLPSINPFYFDTTIANPSLNSYMETSQNANNGSITYNVNALFNPNNFTAGWIKTIFLNVNQLNSTTISLQWNPLELNCPSYNGQTGYETSKYEIYRQRKNETSFTKIGEINFLCGETTPLIFNDTILPVCEDSIVYYIEIANTLTNCYSRSNKANVKVEDNDNPDSAILRSVSTVIAVPQQIVLTWTPSTDIDVEGYIIEKIDGSVITKDTVWGATSTTWTCTSCLPTQVYNFTISSFDTCGNTSLVSARQNNMVLNGTRQACSKKVNFTWNSYINMIGGLSNYEIYYSTDGTNFYLGSTISAIATTGSVDINTSNLNYYFYVKANSNNGTDFSTSNIFHLTLSAAEELAFLYIRSVSVLPSNNQIELSFYLDSTIIVNHYILKRSMDGINFDQVATLPYTGDGTFKHVDNLPLSAETTVYTYVLEAPDACGLAYKSSKAAASMALTAKEKSSEETDLEWNAYEGWNSIGGYEIYRSATASSSLSTMIGTSSIVMYTDNTVSAATNSYNLTYNVICLEGGTGADGKQARASSSYATVKKETLFWIPNAFTPQDNTNNSFKPSIAFIKENSYEMWIYNRYGQILFYTKKINEGWDGTFNGNFVPSATYVYLIKYTDSDGVLQTQKGVVAVVN
jgi:gliding motility-associated-like protein